MVRENYPEHWGTCVHGAHCLLCCEREIKDHEATEEC